MSNLEDIQRLRRELAEAEAAYEDNKRVNQKAVLQNLEQLSKDMNRQYAEAEALARSVGLVFYFSSGYEEFNVVDGENWSSSSMHS